MDSKIRTHIGILLPSPYIEVCPSIYILNYLLINNRAKNIDAPILVTYYKYSTVLNNKRVTLM